MATEWFSFMENDQDLTSLQMAFVRTERGFEPANKKTEEVTFAIPEGVEFKLSFDEEADPESRVYEIDVVSANMEPIGFEDHCLIAEKVTSAILAKSNIPEQYLTDIWSGETRDFRAMSLILRGHVAALRNAEVARKKGESTRAPVLQDELMSRSEISYLAYSMLATVLEDADFGCLSELVGVLLNVDRQESRLLKNREEREKAQYILAQSPETSSHELETQIGVDHTTISRWRKETAFIDGVESLRQLFASDLFQLIQERRKEGLQNTNGIKNP